MEKLKKLAGKILSITLMVFVLLSVGYGIGIVPESWISAVESVTSILDGPKSPWKPVLGESDREKESQASTQQGAQEEALTLEILDVGQADAILAYMDGHYMLVDAGNNADGAAIVKYLESIGVDHLDYVIGTHAHEDHIGGTDDVIKAFDVDYIMLSEEPADTATYRSVVAAAEESPAEKLTPRAGNTYTLGQARWQILSCETGVKDLNESSIVIKLTYGNTSFLLTGDATANNEQELEMSGYDLNSTVLKVGHHGSAHSTSESFLRAVQPEIAIISVDADSDLGQMYRHPSSTTLTRLDRAGAKTYRTDNDGTVILTSNGRNVTMIRRKAPAFRHGDIRRSNRHRMSSNVVKIS